MISDNIIHHTAHYDYKFITIWLVVYLYKIMYYLLWIAYNNNFIVFRF